MSFANLTTDDSLPPDDLVHVIDVCDRFEADWKAGRPARIEDEMAAADDPIRARLLGELLALELELLRRDGRPAELDAYLARFPDRADAVRHGILGGNGNQQPFPEVTQDATNADPASTPRGL